MLYAISLSSRFECNTFYSVKKYINFTNACSKKWHHLSRKYCQHTKSQLPATATRMRAFYTLTADILTQLPYFASCNVFLAIAIKKKNFFFQLKALFATSVCEFCFLFFYFHISVSAAAYLFGHLERLNASAKGDAARQLHENAINSHSWS